MRQLRPGLGVWGLALLLSLVGLWHAAIAPWPLLQRLEWLLGDWQQQRQAATSATVEHPDIVIVDIDDRSLATLGRWPWPRRQLARLSTELLDRQQVAALGFDLVFAEPDDGHFQELAQALGTRAGHEAEQARWQQALAQDPPLARAWQGRPVVLGWYLSERSDSRSGQRPAPVASAPAGGDTPGWPRWQGWTANLPALAQAAPRGGYFNAWVDDDGLVRSVAALSRLDDALYEPLALALWRTAVGEPPLTVQWRERPGGWAATALQVGPPEAARLLPLDPRGAWRVPYQGRGGRAGGRFRYVSAAELLNQTLPAGALKGRLVLVGSSAPGLADLRATPIHPAMPGVEVHAHLLAGLLSGDLPQRPDWSPAYEASLCLALIGLATWLAAGLAAPLALLAMGLLLAAVCQGTAWAETHRQWLLPWAVASGLALLQFMVAMVGNQVREWQRRRAVETLFRSYLSPERVRQLVRQGQGASVSAENRELSILFCDLQGFSHLAETLTPEALKDLLNRYFSATSELIHAHGGTLDKFIGDAVMAFWGAPLPQADHAALSVQAAVALADSLTPLNDTLRQQGLPSVSFGIGVASGLVCVGDLGSERRRSYTAVGDAVNLAARIEALTRELGVAVLIDDSTRQRAQAQLNDWAWLEVAQRQVRGRAQPVTLFTPIAPESAADPATQEMLRTWQLALDAHRQHHDGLAQGHLARLDELFTLYPDHTPAPLPRLAHGLMATAPLATPRVPG